MKIIIPTLGSRGDVQPYIALALGLQRAGHEVTLATHPIMRSLVTSYGVPFAPMGPDIDIGREAAAIRGNSRNWLLGFLRTMRFSFRILEQSHADLLALCQGADLIVVSHTAAGKMEADKLGLPTVSVTLMPQAIPARDPAAPILKRAIMKMAGVGMGLMMTRPLDEIRRKVGLPPMGPAGITSERLNLVPVSPLVAPPNPLWEPRHRVVGYWFAEEPAGWVPPASLQSFLESGDPPVVVSLGAMSLGGADAHASAQLVVDAIQQAGVRAVIQGWDEALAGAPLPTTIRHAGPVPHGWLLACSSAMVHHGGFGTTAASLRAGIPSIVVPHILDQFIWGQRIYELGAGPQPIPRPRLTAARLAEALVQVREDATLRARAQELGSLIRAERGVENAVALIEGMF
mgnify:CR=1 FL=1